MSGLSHSCPFSLLSLNYSGKDPTIPTLARAGPIRTPVISWNLKRTHIWRTQVWSSGSEPGDGRTGLGQDKKGIWMGLTNGEFLYRSQPRKVLLLPPKQLQKGGRKRMQAEKGTLKGLPEMNASIWKGTGRITAVLKRS